MKIIAITLASLALLPMLAHADDVTVTCNVATARQARACLVRLAKVLPEYESPNEVLMANSKSALADLVSNLPASAETVAKVKAAESSGDFTGLIVDDGDERQIRYYAISKGKSVTPIEIVEVNITQIGYYDLPSSKSEKLTPDLFVLGQDASRMQFGSELVEQIKFLKESIRESEKQQDPEGRS